MKISYLFGHMINCDCKCFKTFGIVSKPSSKSVIFAVFFIQDMFKSGQFSIWGHHFWGLAHLDQIGLVVISQIICFFGGFNWIFCKKKKKKSFFFIYVFFFCLSTPFPHWERYDVCYKCKCVVAFLKSGLIIDFYCIFNRM